MTLFREATKDDGTPGELSIRRVLAFIGTVGAFPFFYIGLHIEPIDTVNFIPGIALLVFTVILLLFTTGEDLVALLKAWRK
jgi:hypothetical protein